MKYKVMFTHSLTYLRQIISILEATCLIEIE